MSSTYWPYFCEENVWRLCADPRFAGADLRVLFISNPLRRVAMWGQKISEDPRQPIAWDYHVVLLARASGESWEIWDADASEPSPMPAARWLALSFVGVGLLQPRYAPRFRLIRAPDYLRHFRSDRRHMRLPDGSFRKPPPPWPQIMGEAVGSDDGSNLDRFIDTEDPDFLGECHDLPSLRACLEC